MANLSENDLWEAGIYQIEEDDPVLGGPSGITNMPPRQLASRTLYQRLRSVAPWSAEFPYPAQACVQHGGKTYRSLVANTNVIPGTDAEKWERWGFTLAELNAELTTAPQFDKSTRAATTAFVQSIGFKASARYALTATSTIPVAYAGASLIINSAAATTQTLPLANSVPAGTRISLININTGIASIVRSGADVLYVNVGFVTTVPMGAGDTLVLESNGTNGWDVNGGSVQLQYSAAFGSSLGVSGFKKYPDSNSPTGYVIEQWGTVTCTAAIGNNAVSFPAAFPTVCRSITLGFVLTAPQNFYACGWNSKTPTGFNIFNPQAQAVQYDWRAFGY